MQRAMFVLGVGAWALMAYGCAPQEPECTPAKSEQKVAVSDVTQMVRDRASKDDDRDFCQACVMSPRGYISCQVARAEAGDTREALREKAKERACADARIPASACADVRPMSMRCKGDPLPPGAARNPLRRLIEQNLAGQAGKDSGKGKAAPKGEAEQAQGDADGAQ